MRILIKSEKKKVQFKKVLSIVNINTFIRQNFPNVDTYALSYLDKENDIITISDDLDLTAIKDIMGENQTVEIKVISNLPLQYNTSQIFKSKLQRYDNDLQKKQPLPSPNNNIYPNISCQKCKKIIDLSKVYYTCLYCQLNKFNICQICYSETNKFDHQHSLTKIKNYQSLIMKKYKYCKKLEKKTFKDLIKQSLDIYNTIFDQDNHSENDDSDDQQAFIINNSKTKNISKLQNFHKTFSIGHDANYLKNQQQKYKSFIDINPTLSIDQLLIKYKQQNKINIQMNLKQSFHANLEQITKNLNKILLIYENSMNNKQMTFSQSINELKSKNFMQDMKKNIKDIEVQGKKYEFKTDLNYDQQKKQLNLMKTQKKKQKNHFNFNMFESQSPTLSPKIEMKSEQNKQKKMLQIREKGRILLQMKDLFGQKDSRKYFHFIEENFKEGIQKIIELWIQKSQ